MYISQWERLLKNSGVWKGSFTQFSTQGQQEKDIPSLLKLEPLDNNKKLKLTLTRENKQPIINEFTNLNRNIFLFEEGHFAKGSQQFSPFALFASEYGFIQDDRRCRLVQIYDTKGNLEPVTLIREFQEHGQGVERPPLTIEQLEGEWTGVAQTLYPDWRNTDSYETKLIIKRIGDTIEQTLITPEINFTSKGQIADKTVTFSQSNLDIRLILLPDGVSSTTPLQLKQNEAFFVEFGWLVEPNKRLRIIRRYDPQGRWINVTLVTETKV